MFVGIVICLMLVVFVSAGEVNDKIKDAIGDKGISEESVEAVVEVGLGDLPDEIAIGEVEDTSIAIYQVDYGVDKPLFVITAEGSFVAEEGSFYRQFLSFGFSGVSNESEFLRMSSGVEGSLEMGYVMMRSGSVSGLSSILNGVEGQGDVEIIIYKNGEEVGFRNMLSVSDGVSKDFDFQSEGVVTFEAGDVISVYVSSDEGLTWGDVTTTVEILTE